MGVYNTYCIEIYMQRLRVTIVSLWNSSNKLIFIFYSLIYSYIR